MKTFYSELRKYTTIITQIIMIFGLPLLLQAQQIRLNKTHPDVYTVVKGDTLWDIAGRFLQYPWQWPQIWDINPQIKNPHLIYPGDELALVYVNGKPRIIRRKGGRPTYKLSPNKRIEPIDLAIPTIKLEKIAPFFSGNIIIEPGTLKNAPYIVGTAKKHLIAAQGNEVYVKNLPKTDNFVSYGIYYQGKIYYNPRNHKDILGVEATYLGEADILRKGNPATFVITRSRAEIINGARLIPLQDNEFNKNFMPQPAQTPKVGYIIGSLVSGIQPAVLSVGVSDVVLINFGKQDKIKPGDVFNIYNKGEKVNDPLYMRKQIKLPNKMVGNLLVFRTFKRISYAIVMDAQSVIKKGDIVVSPYMVQKD